MHTHKVMGMEAKKSFNNLYWLILSLFIVIADQISKLYILKNFDLYDVKPLIPGLNLTLAFNTGAAFSFLSSSGGWQRWLFVSLAIAICSWLVIWLKNEDAEPKTCVIGIALVIGGALGNLWDRLSLGHVIDFIDIYVWSYHWPTFNIADSAITVGTILIILNLWQVNLSKKPSN